MRAIMCQGPIIMEFLLLRTAVAAFKSNRRLLNSRTERQLNMIFVNRYIPLLRHWRTSRSDRQFPANFRLSLNAKIAVISCFQPRRMPSRGATAGGGGSGGLGSRTSRRHPQMTFAAMPLSPRDSAMESITELLSQLSGTRRAMSAAAQSAHSAVPSAQQTIHQLQMQLERQHSVLSRQQLSDKLPRRTGALLDVGGAGASGLLPPHQTLSSNQQDGGQQGSLANGPGQSQYLLSR